jgi:hypothetical protein
MTRIQLFTRGYCGVLCSIGLMAVATGQAAEPVPPGATAAETSTVESSEAETNANSDASQAHESGVPERLRHKNRAVTVGAPTAASASGQAASSSRSVQHHETDMNFVSESAATKTPPQQTPEWTYPISSDPGRTESAEKGGTTDIKMGDGENQAAEGDKKDNSKKGDGAN